MSSSMRAAFRALRREFRRASNAYPPLYHERVFIYDFLAKVPPSPEMWRAFLAANGEEERSVSLWNAWHGPSDGSYIGRYSGSPEGVEEFEQLGDSACLILREMDPELPFRLGHYAWLGVLHDMAWEFPTPLLRSELTIWRAPDPLTNDRFEEVAEKWQGGEGGRSGHPIHPMHAVLSHNVFTSSIAAIDVILDTSSALPVRGIISEPTYDLTAWEESYFEDGEWGEDEGNAVVSANAQSESGGVDESPIGKEVKSDEDRRDGVPKITEFRPGKAGWHIEFWTGTDTEEGHFPDTLNGLRLLKVLTDNPGISYGASKLESESGMGAPPDCVGWETIDQAIDSDYKKSISNRVHKLESKIKAARTSEEINKIEEYESEISQIKSHAVKTLSRFGNPRNIGSGTRWMRARGRVSGNINRAIKHLSKQMPKLSEHLMNNIHKGNTLYYSIHIS